MQNLAGRTAALHRCRNGPVTRRWATGLGKRQLPPRQTSPAHTRRAGRQLPVLPSNGRRVTIKAMKIEAPKLPSEPSFAKLQAYKCALRQRDAQRIADGEATPHEIQQQNAVIRPPRKAEVLHFPEAELLEA
jgi:hypothetical protein